MLIKKEEVVLVCRKCGATHLITPPKKKLKKTTEIELVCERCRFRSNYRFSYKLKQIKKRRGIEYWQKRRKELQKKIKE